MFRRRTALPGWGSAVLQISGRHTAGGTTAGAPARSDSAQAPAGAACSKPQTADRVVIPAVRAVVGVDTGPNVGALANVQNLVLPGGRVDGQDRVHARGISQ